MREGWIAPLRDAGAPGRALDEPAAQALGRDPFEAEPAGDPLAARLDALEGGAPSAAAGWQRLAPLAPRRRPAQLRPGRPCVPTLGEIELPEPRTWIERWLGDSDRRVMAAFNHLVDGEGPYDRFGFSPDVMQTAFPFFRALYRGYFRAKSDGHEHIPANGPAILAANHGGLLPFDAAMTVVDVALHTDPPRLVRSVVDRWAGSLPWVNVFFARMGQVIGTRENCAELLEQGQLLLVFPEGLEGIRKNLSQRYRLQPFHVGFVEHALRRQAPIVPTAIVGGDDQAPILYDAKSIARWLGVPVLPVTPTFPWLGPLGLLPYPVRYRIRYGEPLDYHLRFGAEGADDARLVHYLAKQARGSIQKLLDRSRP